VSGDLGHLARAARTAGAALVDVVNLEGRPAALAALLTIYHRVTRVSFHESLNDLDRAYDVLLALGEGPVPAEAAALAGALVITGGGSGIGEVRARFPARRTLLEREPQVVAWAHAEAELARP
jgi:hypothetical protein